jgi:hypothetical protein
MKIYDIINENSNRSDIIRKTAADLNIPFAIAMELFNKESKTGQFDKNGDTVVGDNNRTNKAFGMGQVRLPALKDVNRLYGTNYSLADIKNDANINAKVGLLYFKAQGDHYGANDYIEQLRGYNGGPNAIKGDVEAANNYANDIFDKAVLNYEGPDALENFYSKTLTNEDGVIVPGVNTTVDVKPGETERQAAKFGNGKIKPLMPKRGKSQSINTLYNMGLAEKTSK